MAILLRQRGEESLNQAGLSEFYIDLSPTSKVLTVYDQICGKPVTSIPGITFSNLKPTVNEMEYACELLDLWLSTNKVQIKTYLNTRAKYLLAGCTPNATKGNLEINFTNVYCNRGQNYQHTVSSVSINQDGMMFVMAANKLLASVQWNENQSFLNGINLTKANRKAAENFIDIHTAHLILTEEMNNAALNLNTCSI